mgnify:CR=1 FL=1
MTNKDNRDKIVLKTNKIILGEKEPEKAEKKPARPPVRKTSIQIYRETDDTMFEIDSILREFTSSSSSVQSKFAFGIHLYRLALTLIDKSRLEGKTNAEIEKEVFRFCKEKLAE